MPLAKLSSKSQIVVPAAIRRQLGLQPGDSLQIIAREDCFIVRKAPVSFVEQLDRCGSEHWVGYEAELDEARDKWDE